METKQDRPAYVAFERRAVEDRAASIETGIYSTKDVDFALITPAGSKDRTERVVSEWLENLKQQSSEGRIPVEWHRAYKEAYAAWKEDRALPETGHPIVNWAVASPAQQKSLLDLHVRTVEDLASANEETLGRLGMGGRALKQRAVDFLASSTPGKLSGDLEVLRQENEALKLRNASLEDQVRALTLLAEAKPQKL